MVVVGRAFFSGLTRSFASKSPFSRHNFLPTPDVAKHVLLVRIFCPIAVPYARNSLLSVCHSPFSVLNDSIQIFYLLIK